MFVGIPPKKTFSYENQASSSSRAYPFVTYYRQVNINQSKNADEQLVKTLCGSFLIFLAPSNHLEAERV